MYLVDSRRTQCGLRDGLAKFPHFDNAAYERLACDNLSEQRTFRWPVLPMEAPMPERPSPRFVPSTFLRISFNGITRCVSSFSKQTYSARAFQLHSTAHGQIGPIEGDLPFDDGTLRISGK